MKNYDNLMKGEIGYEHYFINYYLYIPFSMAQEKTATEESIKTMREMNLLKSGNQEFLEKLTIFFEKLNSVTNVEVKEIKRKLNLPNKKRVENLIKDLTEGDTSNQFYLISKYFPNYVNKLKSDSISGVIQENKSILNTHDQITSETEIYPEDDETLQNIIYGDYKIKNENVEVYLHQRTTKKVKYKKREYNLIHPIDEKLINSLNL